jgi:hypothetical protein
MAFDIAIPLVREVVLKDHARFCADLADLSLDELRDVIRVLQLEIQASRPRLTVGPAPHANPKNMDGWISQTDSYWFDETLGNWIST